MAVIRKHQTKDYTIMSNYHFRDKNLSLKAKGLLSEMLSLPDKWEYSIVGLVAINKESQTSIKSALEELKENKYLIVTKQKSGETGQFEYTYDIYEQPYEDIEKENEDVENLDIKNPDIENLHMGNVIQYNTNNKILNNKILNNKILNNKLLNNNINKKEKKESEFDKLINDKIQNDELKDAIYEFIKMRKTIKKPLTTRGLELALNKLNKLSSDIDEQIEILNKAIMNNWQGLYELNPQEKQEFLKDHKKEKQLYKTYDFSKLSPEDYGRYMKKQVTAEQLEQEGKLIAEYI
jgi:hypothetical protein